MSYLQEKLAEAERDAVVRDTVRLIDQEVARKKGLTGVALKAGYKAVKTLKEGRMIERAADSLLDEFADALEPLHAAWRSGEGAAHFADYLAAHQKEASAALLSITDEKAKKAESRVIASTYKKLRPAAERHVADALPGVGRLIETYAPRADERG